MKILRLALVVCLLASSAVADGSYQAFYRTADSQQTFFQTQFLTYIVVRPGYWGPERDDAVRVQHLHAGQ